MTRSISTSPGLDASPSQVTPPQFVRFNQQFAGTHLGGETHCESKVSCPRSELEPGPLAPESSALTMRQPCLPRMYTTGKLYLILSTSDSAWTIVILLSYWLLWSCFFHSKIHISARPDLVLLALPAFFFLWFFFFYPKQGETYTPRVPLLSHCVQVVTGMQTFPTEETFYKTPTALEIPIKLHTFLKFLVTQKPPPHPPGNSNPFCERNMGIFWNCTVQFNLHMF